MQMIGFIFNGLVQIIIIRNDGQGTAGTDRTNIVQTNARNLNIGRKLSEVTMFLTKEGKPDADVINKFAMLGQTGCATTEEVNAAGNRDNNVNNCGRLNRALSPYFDAGLIQMKASGTFSYMCTRNNNFSNRSHKAQLIVRGGQFNSALGKSISMAMVILAALVFFY